MRKYNPKSPKIIKTAKERINELFKQAKCADDTLSNRYVTLARKISMKYKVRIPSELKRRFCKHCYKYLRQGKTVRVRRTPKGIVYTCLHCNKQTRFPIK
ncbi:ribonuclease P [Candidatus Woesearchaeota archaeon]|jgi:ribonuclease P protein subunit RPR2|nr:ribonuclease P [Candidatus Woesearchaeota archaeon]MBT4368550.1 ribonuclease P [Candidatus Woesearchaeota archaeon]MBT4713039.1 ribonuclease P [Candidatus Woesearchaeota archaeon]MBT6639951.1 ribonuclease P [Candidatus Woesearchaeota archaeon]MBT7134123.1 ribonuclease P [Candidatus Woesearchaeota archaeon]